MAVGAVVGVEDGSGVAVGTAVAVGEGVGAATVTLLKVICSGWGGLLVEQAVRARSSISVGTVVIENNLIICPRARFLP